METSHLYGVLVKIEKHLSELKMTELANLQNSKQILNEIRRLKNSNN